MKQPKKIFTRMLINNWGGISHKMLEFHEYVNLFSGKSGSGKSTVMDAIQVVLYGSVSANFLNKAADDSKNKRSVLSYLRGAQKDGTANRGDVDFCSQIVLEIEDTATHIVTCVGVRDVEDDTPIYIYSTINLYVTAKDMNDLIEEYREEADGYETAEENFYKNADQ